jgi:peptidoglycan/xylan/chitin deacetylase (PgdA/CDA1 family)
VTNAKSLASDSPSSRAVTGFATAGLALPAVLPVADTRAWSWFALAFLAVVIAVATAWWVAARAPRPGLTLATVGGLLVALVGWVLPQGEVSLNTLLFGVGLGAGVGIGGGGLQALRDRAGAAGAAAGIGVLAVLVAIDGTHGIAWAGLVYGASVVIAAARAGGTHREHAAKSVRWVTGVAAVLLIAATLWVGANSPTETWFGSQVSHGPRGRREVAITFDDGPNNPYTLDIARILDAHDAKGTFFVVGKAVDARPDIVRALRDDGHLLGSHSYHHDSWRWLDPRYPELERTQRAVRRRAGVCPTFFRPPHGQHTPFMVRVLDDHGMTMVGWDVSAGDWKAHDARAVARSVNEDVQPGSIIVLHDGLDGNVTADRAVVVRALPMILDGLQRKGLKPVRLDALLDERGYGDHC